MTVMQPIIYARYDGEEYRERIQDLDSRRRIAHEGAISACNILNRICDNYGVSRIADINTEDRYEVTDFIGQYCAEVYEEGRSKNPAKEAEKIRTADKLMEHRGSRHDEYPADGKNRFEQLDASLQGLLDENQGANNGYGLG